MFFEHIELHDFRSHVETSLDLARITVIRGPNAAGKSTLAQAFGYLLAGRSADTGENGQGGERLIRAGAKKAMVMAKLRSGAKARVTLTPKSGRDFQFKDGEWPRFSRDVLSCLCETSYFLDLPEKRQHELIGAMVIPPDAELPEPLLEIIARTGAPRPGEQANANDYLAMLYQQSFEMRRDAKRDLKNLIPVEPPDAEAFPLEEVRTRLFQRRNERDATRDERAEAMQAASVWRRDYASLRERHATLDGREAAEAQRVGALQAKLLPDAVYAKHEKAIERDPERQRLMTRFAEIDAELRELDKKKAALFTLEDAAVCPTCQQKLTPEHIDSVVSPISEASGRLLSQRSDIARQLQEMPSAEDARAKIMAHQHAKDELKIAEQRLEQIRTDLNHIATDLAKLGEEPTRADTAKLDAKIVELDARILEGERAERAALRAEQSRKEYDTYVARRAELEASVADLEQLVAFTAPEGVRAALAEKYMGEFMAVMGEVLSNFGYDVNIHGAEWTLNNFEINRLSVSEQWRFAVALQVALAVSSGAGFLIVDEFELLDSASRGLLMMVLMDDPRLEQVIVIGTNDSHEIRAIEDTAFYRFEREADGTSRAVMLEAEEEEVTA